MSKAWTSIVSLLLAGGLFALVGCGQRDVPAPAAPSTNASAPDNDEGGAISSPARIAQPLTDEVLKGTKWPPAELTSGTAAISCDTDYATAGDGQPLVDLGYLSVLDAMSPCREAGVVRLRYEGKISADFAELVERVSAMAERMEIGKRILDIDSAGGQVEDAIRAGDTIGDSRWTIWVREGDLCHSACVFILAAGDNRLISGPVGVHRIIRLHSNATTRAELEKELRAVHERIKEYFSQNGVDVAVADMMMTVPSSDLRLLTADELRQYGLSGSNPVQDDLERIRLARKCGEAFVHRRERFVRAFDKKCAGDQAGAAQGVDSLSECGMKLRKRYGFPDRRCPAESPLSEYD